jgi:hypothetical protein
VHASTPPSSARRVAFSTLWLWPTSYDPEQRVVRYRAKPAVCSACPVKHSCTTSSHGREVTREIDPWPYSEAGRFHRGIACWVAAIGVLLPLGMLFSKPNLVDLLALLATILEIKDVEIPEAMQRAMAREAEAERQRRAKIINARGELQASEELRQAADTLTLNPASLQLRYLQTLLELGADQNSTVVFPLPLDIVGPFLNNLTRGGSVALPNGATPSHATS